jgi:hypothetical protein
VVVAMAPASAARGMAVTPACKLPMACHLSKNARGGCDRVRCKGGCGARLTRATRNGDGRGREGNAGRMCGASGVLPWPLQAGGVAVWGMEGGGREGGYRGGAGGEALDGPGAVWDGRRWGRQCSGAANYGRGCLWAGKQQVGKAVGPGRTFKVLSQRGRKGGRGALGGGWNLPAWVWD